MSVMWLYAIGAVVAGVFFSILLVEIVLLPVAIGGVRAAEWIKAKLGRGP